MVLKKKTIRKVIWITVFSLFTGVFLQFSDSISSELIDPVGARRILPPFLTADTTNWVDSVMETLSLEDKVAQMFMVPVYPERGEANKKKIGQLIKKYRVGGIIVFQGKPDQVYELTNYYQSISEIPLLVSIDAEWGLSMRLENTIGYPKQMTLGAIQDEQLLIRMGRDLGSQLRSLGINMNFAPVVDVNINPYNPVINIRSFGEDPVNVAKKGYFYMKGMQENGILTVAKHFPGHGDTHLDSHHSLPVIKHSRERLDSIELLPFKLLINQGVDGIMTAHLNVLSLDSVINLPSTLSPLIADSLLQKELDFQGLVMTDAMNMRGVSNYFEPVDANIKAVEAGNDILLMPAEVEKSIRQIVRKVKRGEISDSLIDARCRKILKAKYWVNNASYDTLDYKNDIDKPEFQLTKQKLIEASLTVIKNDQDILPIQNLDTLKIASVSLGSASGEEFIKTLNLYTTVDNFDFSNRKNLVTDELMDSLSDYNLVIVSLHSESIWNIKDYGINSEMLRATDSLISRFPVVLVNFTNPYLLAHVKNLLNAKVIIEAFENGNQFQSYAAQMIFGAIPASGKLPVSINHKVKVGTGISFKGINRLKYTMPIEVGIDKDALLSIDTIVAEAINEKAMPGCQVLVARDGKVFFHKAYGYHTYSKKHPVLLSDIYDLASVTKITATLPMMMHLEEEGKINLEHTIGEYLPEFDTTNKADLVLYDILLHQAGLTAWIPFYLSTIEPIYPSQRIFTRRYSSRYPIRVGSYYYNKHIKYKDDYYDIRPSADYQIEVAKGLFMNNMFLDSIKLSIYSSDVRERGKYLYSDLGFYMFYWMIERLEGEKFEKLVDSLFYKPLGATTLGFLPQKKFDLSRIVPTENDLVFRKQIVHGYVHDYGAAMLGGVCGHAGLFSNANDLAKLMQVYLNKGTYGGKTYLDDKLIEHYTDCLECENGNRRGLGFDKPSPDTTKPSPAFQGIPIQSYGHAGFTGTIAWMDPVNNILYIFLSNRVYPDASDNKLVKLNTRTRIQEAIYKGIIK